jgi:aspartate/methionine/tyrosine aminotransferase
VLGNHAVKIDTFEMERWQSKYGHLVEYDLSESGVQPLRLEELLGSDDAVRKLLATGLGYPASKGSPALREIIASLYRDASPDQVLVTNGSSESIFATGWRLFEKGDEIVVMLPNYMQYPGLVRAFGGRVRPLELRERLRWQFDPNDLGELVSKKTKAIAICNPDNPTGAIMAAEQRKALIDAAKDVGAWILSDEAYIGAEREAPRTETLFGAYDRVLVTSGLSKAYAMPGLRLGWTMGPLDVVQDLYRYHDYLTLTPTKLSDELAQVVLQPPRRETILARTRSILRTNYGVLREWLDRQGTMFEHVSPEAGAICYIRYGFDMNSTAFAERLRKEKSVLIVPGDQFGMDGFIRVGMGNEKPRLLAALDRIAALVKDLKAGRPSAR